MSNLLRIKQKKVVSLMKLVSLEVNKDLTLFTCFDVLVKCVKIH